ncbi:SF0329 family protein [Lysinibacillus telephonicus]|uniref:SF0329 family protein n=1 Tax=Lysinibacillus telephonicus TaxID=1714840 RepID=UPI0037D94C5D
MLYSPKWSKAKKHLKSFICDSLQSRINFQVINYRRAHDQLGRAVITVDKIEKLSMCTITAEREEFRRTWDKRIEMEDFDFDDVEMNRSLQDQSHEQLKKDGIYGQYDFFDALEKYFNAPIKDSLKSTDILIKILCLLDRRVGKRTLLKMKETILTEHVLVQDFYKLRCEAENILVAV